VKKKKLKENSGIYIGDSIRGRGEGEEQIIERLRVKIGEKKVTPKVYLGAVQVKNEVGDRLGGKKAERQEEDPSRLTCGVNNRCFYECRKVRS